MKSYITSPYHQKVVRACGINMLFRIQVEEYSSFRLLSQPLFYSSKAQFSHRDLASCHSVSDIGGDWQWAPGN